VDSEDVVYTENNDVSHLTKPSKPLVQKSKLVVVDLAGSERIHKVYTETELKICVCVHLCTQICMHVIIIIELCL